MTIKKEMDEYKARLIQTYFQDVYIQKNEGAFENGHELIKRLEETKTWITCLKNAIGLWQANQLKKDIFKQRTL